VRQCSGMSPERGPADAVESDVDVRIAAWEPRVHHEGNFVIQPDCVSKPRWFTSAVKRPPRTISPLTKNPVRLMHTFA